MQIGAADPAGQDVEGKLSGAWLGVGQGHRPQRLSRMFEDDGAHEPMMPGLRPRVCA
jgi:hypothetical protein